MGKETESLDNTIKQLELIHVSVKVTQWCQALCNPLVAQSKEFSRIWELVLARIPEWVAFPSSRGSFQPRDKTQVSHIAAEPRRKPKTHIQSTNQKQYSNLSSELKEIGTFTSVWN